MAAITFNDAGPTRPRRRRWEKADTAVVVHPNLQPLDPEIVSAAIPAFFIGRNKAGLWVAREAQGRLGGLFLFKRSAVHFAHAQSRPARCALIFPSETFELDIENRGNPLVGELAKWMVRATRHLARLATR
ncbi:hypothetical protein Q2941_07400 [Bradyrhizobium sp. UFLA05-153]